MSALEYWVGSLLIAAVRQQRDVTWAATLYYKRPGGYRSLLFRLNSHAYHERARR